MIENAILGLLSWKPLSGYDLKKIMSDSSLFYWSGNNNQIYRTLLELHRNGLVTQQVQYQESLPARKIYSITAAGLERLRQWLISDPEISEPHSSFLIQLCWADLLTSQELDALLAKYEAELEARLLIEQEKARRDDNTPGRSRRETFLWQQISGRVCQAYQSELDWVRRMRAELIEKGL